MLAGARRPILGGMQPMVRRTLCWRSRRLLGATFAGAVAVVALAVGAPAGASSEPRSFDACTSSPSAEASQSPLRGICRYLEGRKGVVQVALFDKRAGRSYSISTGDDRQLTASIVKVDILAKWLHRLQRRVARIPGEIPYSVKYLMRQMIKHSDNSAATGLFYFGGGCEALTRFNRLIPLEETKVGCQSPTYYGWGNTTTTAADQVRLMKVFAYGKRQILRHEARSYALRLMERIEPDQRWGISCGPWGTSCDAPKYARPDPDVTVALKNGWKTLPSCSKRIEQCPWQVNSTGWVRGRGRNYLLTLLTTHDPVGSGGEYGFNYGIDTIQNVSERIWGNLG